VNPRPLVLIADDHPLMAQGLRALIAPFCDVVALVQDARQVEAAIEEHQPDLLLLDLSMPHRNGLELLLELRKRFRALRVLVVTMHTDRALAEQAFLNGADGFIPKEAPADELHTAIATVLHGRRYLSPRVPRRGFRGDEVLQEGLTEGLTPRQREVLRLMGEGKTTPQIATALGLSQRTVEFHRARTRRALGITSEWELVRFAIMVRLGTAGDAQPLPTPETAGEG
jgi:DNA-binding NarL/FixJ family response regulator